MAKALGHGIGAFLHIYVLKKGFLDGWAGFIIALGNFEEHSTDMGNSWKGSRVGTSLRKTLKYNGRYKRFHL